MKKNRKKLRINKETLIHLQSSSLSKVAGGWIVFETTGCQTEVASVCIEATCDVCPHDVPNDP